jgi:1-acyl-sn-glycerol-3-phosphate acyltransferase
MEQEISPTKAIPEPHRVSRGIVLIQWLLGLPLQFILALPFLRRTHGRDRVNRHQQYLFVVNHISLLDTLLLATICWRLRLYPILVLGDKGVWHASWIRKFLSRSTAFLLERGKLNPSRIRELQAYGRSGKEFQLIVFPEGTRGDGVNVATCQPGIYFISQEAQIPIVPVFIENMQLLSTKKGRFHPIRGFRKVELHIGQPILPDKYLSLPREEFLEFIRQSILAARGSATRD